jgi:Ca2+:H+ antiporter
MNAMHADIFAKWTWIVPLVAWLVLVASMFMPGAVVLSLAVLCAMSVLTLVLPNYATTVPGPGLASSQLIFAGFISLLLYLVFVFIQTISHRDYFLVNSADENEHAAPPTNRFAVASLALLIVSLVAVVGLAKTLSPVVENAVSHFGAPAAVVGIIIAALVLTLIVGVITLGTGRTTLLQGVIHLVIFAAFLFFAVVP